MAINRVVTVIPAMDTAIFADGDVACPTKAFALPNRNKLSQVVVVDADDQGAAMDIYFFRNNVSLGTVNSPPNISDTDMQNAATAFVKVATTDYLDAGGVRVATKPISPDVTLESDDGTTVYMGIIVHGTPTFTASGQMIKLTFE